MFNQMIPLMVLFTIKNEIYNTILEAMDVLFV